MFLFLIDCAVVILAGLCVGLNEGLYAMIAIFVSSKLIDMVMAGLSQTKACFIITSALESVTQRVMTELDRGVTHLEAKGAYSGQNRPMILCVLSSQEVARLKDIVRERTSRRSCLLPAPMRPWERGSPNLEEIHNTVRNGN